MPVYDLKSNRELCWDMRIVDEAENVHLAIHKPERRGIAMDSTGIPWEESSSSTPLPVKIAQ